MPEHGSFWRRMIGAAGSLLLLLAVAAAVWRIFLFPWAANWGSTREERTKPLPGDEFGDSSAPQRTSALTIRAPAGEVWKWLVQIGQDRGGFYSYTFLENLVGAGIRNTNEIRPQWQELRAGDAVRLARDDGVVQPKVLAVEPGRSLVLEFWGAFVLEPAPGGSCRLLVRSRGVGKPLARFILSLVLDPIHFLMQRRMLLGIKALAEAPTAAERPVIPGTADYAWFFSILGSGLLILVVLFAGRRPGRLPAAACLTALLTLALFRFPPVPLTGIVLAAATLLVLLWRRGWFGRFRPGPMRGGDGDNGGVR